MQATIGLAKCASFFILNEAKVELLWRFKYHFFNQLPFSICILPNDTRNYTPHDL